MTIQELENNKLSLKNEGRLSLFFIGVGSAFSKLNNQTNLLITKGDDHILIDCGTKCSQALVELGISIPDIQNYLITHSHADHIGGLEESSLLGRYFVKKKPKMIINQTYQKILWEMSLMGGCAYSEGNGGTLLTFEDFWEPLRPKLISGMPREMEEINIGKINIKIFRTKHIPDLSTSWKTSFLSYGVIIDDRILFTSDTQYDEDMIFSLDKIFKFEVIFHDCQLYPGGVHSYLEDLNKLPITVKNRMYLDHYGDNWIKFEDKVKEYGFIGFAKQQSFYIFD